MESEKHFPKQCVHLPKKVSYKGGVGVGDIQEKSRISQSIVSSHLNMMQKAGLLQSIHHGLWTYYSHNEEFIQQLAKYFKTEI